MFRVLRVLRGLKVSGALRSFGGFGFFGSGFEVFWLWMFRALAVYGSGVEFRVKVRDSGSGLRV